MMLSLFLHGLTVINDLSRESYMYIQVIRKKATQRIGILQCIGQVAIFHTIVNYPSIDAILPPIVGNRSLEQEEKRTKNHIG